MSQNQNQEAMKSADEMARKLFGPLDELTIASQLSALRQEVQQLRETLQPPKSMLITGPEVERVMAALATKQVGDKCLPIRGNQVTCSRGTGGCGIQHKGGE